MRYMHAMGTNGSTIIVFLQGGRRCGVNSSSGYYWFQPYSSTVTNPEQGRPRYFTVCCWVQLYSVGVATIHIRRCMHAWLWLYAEAYGVGLYLLWACTCQCSASMCSYDWNVEMCDILLAEWLGASLVNCPLPTKQCFLFTTYDSYSIVIAIVYDRLFVLKHIKLVFMAV